MKKRALSFLLALVMAILAVPAFALSSGAAEVPADYSTKWTENLPKVDPAAGTVTYPSAAWSIGYKADAHTFVPFGKYASGGGADAKLISSTGYDQWDNGGYYSASYNWAYARAGIVAGKYVAYRYVAEHTGTAVLSVSSLFMLANGPAVTGDASSAFAIAVNGEVKWPKGATYDDKNTWHYENTVGADISNTIDDVTVSLNKGDSVEFLFANIKSAWSHYKFDATVTYTAFSTDLNLPYTSRWLDSYPAISGGAVVMPDGPWSIGRLSADRIMLYTKNPSESILVDSDLWGAGGIFLGSKQNGNATTKHTGSRYMVIKRNTYVTYTAEYTGTATFSVSDLKVDGANGSTESSFVICLMQNGKVVWPANAKADNVATWYTPTKVRTNLADEIPAIPLDVKKGDAISFVVAPNGKGGEGAWGCYDLNPSITYTALETAETNKGVFETPIVTPFNAFIAIDDQAEKVLYTGVWKPVQYNRGNETKASDAAILNSIKVTPNGYFVQPAAQTGTGHNGGWASYMATNGCSWAPMNYFSIPANVSTGWRYDVPSTGIYNFKVDSLIQGLGCASEATVKNVHFAIYVNNVKVWPAGDAWYTLPTFKTDYAAAVNEAAASVLNNVELTMGDKVEFLLNGEGGAWDCVAGATFTATQIAQTAAPKAPVVENGSITLNNKFAANFYVDTEALPENATEVGAYVNGEFVAADETGMVTLGDIAAKNLADEITVQPVYTVGVKKVEGEAQTVTAAAMLMQYVKNGTEAEKNLAIATLNYAAAAQEFFGYNTENLANAALTEAQKAVTDENNYESTAKIITNPTEARVASVYGVKLMLNDTVDVAIYFKSNVDLTADNYCLIYSVDMEAEPTLATDVEITKVGEGLYKAILTGFTPTVWGQQTVFGLANMAAENEELLVVSDALMYSVTDYCYRMQGTAVDAVVDAMLALYEAATAYRA